MLVELVEDIDMDADTVASVVAQEVEEGEEGASIRKKRKI